MSTAAEIVPGPSRKVTSDTLFITALGFGQICSWESLYYSFPQLAEAIGRDLGWSKPELYGAATLGLTLSGLAAYPVGAVIDRGHGRTVMGAASVLAGLLMLARRALNQNRGGFPFAVNCDSPSLEVDHGQELRI